MKIEIPGYRTLEIEHLLLDYNGPIAEDGVIRRSVRDLLLLLSGRLDLHVLTADTFMARQSQSVKGFLCTWIPFLLRTPPRGSWQNFRSWGLPAAPCIGNGRNDLPMLSSAAFP